MSSCVNRVVLIGNLGADPDTRFTPSATQVVTANLATDDSWTDRHGKKHQQTEWHRLVFWRRLAEIATDYLHKGSRIHIEGRLKSRTWEDDDGNRHFLTEIVVSDLQILDGSGNGPAELDLLYGRDQLHGSEQATIALASTALASTAGAQNTETRIAAAGPAAGISVSDISAAGDSGIGDSVTGEIGTGEITVGGTRTGRRVTGAPGITDLFTGESGEEVEDGLPF